MIFTVFKAILVSAFLAMASQRQVLSIEGALGAEGGGNSPPPPPLRLQSVVKATSQLVPPLRFHVLHILDMPICLITNLLPSFQCPYFASAALALFKGVPIFVLEIFFFEKRKAFEVRHIALKKQAFGFLLREFHFNSKMTGNIESLFFFTAFNSRSE